MDKEAVVHICNGMLLGHKKEHLWVCSNEVDEPRTYYTEWSKSERGKTNIIYINTYNRNLDRRTDEPIYRAAVETNTDIENRLVDTDGKEGMEELREGSVETYMLPYAK